MTSPCLPTPVLSHPSRHQLRDNSVVQPAVITDPPHLRSPNAGTPAVTTNQPPSLRALNAEAMSRKGNVRSIWLRLAKSASSLSHKDIHIAADVQNSFWKLFHKVNYARPRLISHAWLRARKSYRRRWMGYKDGLSPRRFQDYKNTRTQYNSSSKVRPYPTLQRPTPLHQPQSIF